MLFNLFLVQEVCNAILSLKVDNDQIGNLFSIIAKTQALEIKCFKKGINVQKLKNDVVF